MILIFKANQKNIWESLEALATICMKANRYQQALSYMERAMSIFMINFQRKEMHKKSLIEKRLNIKMNKIREICGIANLRPSKSLTNLSNDDFAGLNSNREGMGSQRNLSSRPTQQHSNWLDNLHSSSSNEELDDSSDENNLSKRSEPKGQAQPLGVKESNLENRSSVGQDLPRKPLENEVDDSQPANKNPPVIKLTPSTLPSSILSGNRSDTNWSKNI